MLVSKRYLIHNFFNCFIGESGSGKRTLLKSLFPNLSLPQYQDAISSIQFEEIDHLVEEGGVQLRLHITIANGYGDFVNNETHWNSLNEKIQQGLEEYFVSENDLYRDATRQDRRYHVCLYLIPSWTTKLRQIDLVILKKLSTLVNILPLLSRSDAYTSTELLQMKNRIRHDLSIHQISTFIPTFDMADDEKYMDQIKMLEAFQPFALSGADQSRQQVYPWGTVIIDSDQIFDFSRLTSILVRHCYVGLIQRTNEFYESFRRTKSTNSKDNDPQKSAISTDQLEKIRNFKKEKSNQLETLKESLSIERQNKFRANLSQLQSKRDDLQKMEEERLVLQRHFDTLKSRKDQLKIQSEERRTTIIGSSLNSPRSPLA